MKKISDYVQSINEYRTKGATSKKGKDVEVKAGVDAENNASKGLYGINEPEDDEAVEPLDKEKLNKNMKRLLMKFKTEEDFFIVGKAGWGKTSIIKDMAKRFHREVITVYLDKAVATDLGGIPIPVKGKNGAVQEMALPAWAKKMEDHPDQKFLLFFDEMNQAQPDVMNALMPIVLEHEICGRKFGPKVDTGKKDEDGNPIMEVKESNFFVGAAGNFESENGAVNELSGPLKSRFKPLIVWETGTPESWKSAFEYIRKNWGTDDDSNDLISAFEDAATLFDNPREVEQKIIRHAIKLKQSGDDDLFDASDYLDRLEGLARTDLQRSEKAQLADLADKLFDFVKGESQKTGRSAKGGKDRNMIPEKILNALKFGIKRGYIVGDDDVKYGISRENITTIQELDEGVNAEMLERAVAKLEAEGLKFKFEKDDEWRKAGYKDPNED